jgi:hypothetical protein
VEVCPAKSKEETRKKAINMAPRKVLETSAPNIDFFETMPLK